MNKWQIEQARDLAYERGGEDQAMGFPNNPAAWGYEGRLADDYRDGWENGLMQSEKEKQA